MEPTRTPFHGREKVVEEIKKNVYDGVTTRKVGISTGRKPLVSTGFSPGTARSVLNAFAFNTGRADRY